MLRVPRTTTRFAKCRCRLSKYILNVRKGRVTESEDEIQLMKDLVSRYSVPTAPPPAITQSNSTHKALEIGHVGNDNPRGERIVRLLWLSLGVYWPLTSLSCRHVKATRVLTD